MKIQNPHDKFFKETFGNLAVAKDFLRNYLPQNIMDIVDINSLEPQKDSFINEELQEVFSDMLFQVDINNKEGYIYFLFEHKSYPSQNIAFQLLNYMVQIWERKMKIEIDHKIPVVIPLVIYHGKETLKIKTSLGEMIRGYEDLPEEIRAYIPNYHYVLYNISRYSDDEIKGEAQLQILLSIFRDIFTKNSDGIQATIYRDMATLQELDDKETGMGYFQTFIRYVFNAGSQLTKNDINKIIYKLETTYPEGSATIMTLAEILRDEGKNEGRIQGIKEGLKEGLEQGMEKGMEVGAKSRALEVARKLIKMNLNLDQIVESTGLPKKEIAKLIKEMSC